jgi:hypothetical protein
MTFDDWLATDGDYLNDSDDAARAARLMARRAWDAAVAAERERCAKLCDEMAAESPKDDSDRDAIEGAPLAFVPANLGGEA